MATITTTQPTTRRVRSPSAVHQDRYYGEYFSRYWVQSRRGGDPEFGVAQGLFSKFALALACITATFPGQVEVRLQGAVRRIVTFALTDGSRRAARLARRIPLSGRRGQGLLRLQLPEPSRYS